MYDVHLCGNDPPMDITILMDVAPSPGPSGNKNITEAYRLKPEQNQLLKLYSLLRSRGEYASKRKRLSAFYKGTHDILQRNPEYQTQVVIGNRHGIHHFGSSCMPSALKHYRSKHLLLHSPIEMQLITHGLCWRMLVRYSINLMNWNWGSTTIRQTNCNNWVMDNPKHFAWAILCGWLQYLQQVQKWWWCFALYEGTFTSFNDWLHVPPEIEGEWFMLHRPKFQRCAPFAVYCVTAQVLPNLQIFRDLCILHLALILIR